MAFYIPEAHEVDDGVVRAGLLRALPHHLPHGLRTVRLEVAVELQLPSQLLRSLLGGGGGSGQRQPEGLKVVAEASEDLVQLVQGQVVPLGSYGCGALIVRP